MGYYIKEGDTVKGKDDEDTKVVRVMEVIVSRHGVKDSKEDPRGDEFVNLVPSSPPSIYDKVKEKLPKVYDPNRVYFASSPAARADQSARTIALAKTGRRKPKNLEELAESDFTGISSKSDVRLGIYPGEFNIDSAKKHGTKYIVDYALQNPEAVQQDGQLIEPHVSVESRLRDSLRDGIEKVLSGQYDCAILVSDGYHVETMRGIMNGRGKTAKTMADLGGEFQMEEFDAIRIAELEDGTYKCFVEYNGHVEERKLKDIVGYEVKGDKQRTQALSRILQEERMYEQEQARPQAPAALGRN